MFDSMLRFGAKTVAAAALMGAMAAPAAAQDVDLVLCIDGSGSISADGFNIEIGGTADAVENVIPHDGSVRLTVIQFATDSEIEVGPVVITQANWMDVFDQIMAISYMDGSTNIAGCIEDAESVLDTSIDRAVLDISTDGNPNIPSWATGEQASYDAAEHAFNAGFDAINAIAIDDGVNDTFLDGLVLPQTGDEQGFWVQADTIDDYPEVLAGKIEREIGCVNAEADVLCSTDESGDFRVTLTFENNSESEVQHLFLIEQTLGVVVDPPYINFGNDPVCTSQDPFCFDNTREIEVTISGASEGDLVDILMQPFGPHFEECCSNFVTIEMPTCECAQIPETSLTCRWEDKWMTDPQWTLNFEVENLSDFEVDDLLIFPITPLNLEIAPPLFTGLGLSPVPWTGTDGSANLSVGLDAPQLQAGDEVCVQLNFHDDSHDECCDIVECFELPACRSWIPWPHEPVPYPTELEPDRGDDGDDRGDDRGDDGTLGTSDGDTRGTDTRTSDTRR